jgi:hypothetical protein
MFILLYAVFTKFFPIVSIWEIREGRAGVKEVEERLLTYLPDRAEPELAATERRGAG